MNTDLVYIDSDTERFAVALFIAALIHVVIIYGIGFTMPKPATPLNTTMEIILVQKSTDKAPRHADYLAQVNHEGGGDRSQKVRPATPTIAPFPDQIATVIFTPPPPQVALTPKEHQIEILTTEKPTPYKVEQHQEIIPPDEPAEQGYDSETYVSEDIFYENSQLIKTFEVKLASIQAELNEKFENYAKRPRKTFISSSTQEYESATYMDAWRRKVEEIGNANYPEKARDQKLSGSLILDVALNSNGTIHRIEIKQPSEYKVLDEAALRSVRLAAPFDPFPENIRKNTDILHITRTWEFRYNSLSSW